MASQLRLALIPLVRELRHQAGPDLTPTLVSALVTVAKEGPLTLGELAGREHVSQPMITKVTGTLVEEGLAIKEPDPGDRRVCRLRITAKGERVLERSRTRKNAWLARRLRTLDDDERAVLVAAMPLLEKLAEAR